MSNKKISIKQQVQNNLIAIISIVIAITSLAYNTWRNEQTEFNRNVRTSSFQILMSLAELQLLVDSAFYNAVENNADPIKGWRHVLYVQDLAQTVSPKVKTDADNLHQVWTEHWQLMDEQENSNKQINLAIESNRQLVLSTLQGLQ
ncbi:hypothetical protein RI844_19140 [Thalassotalea fonticola]|uniref:Uncharacterized protein n=1 Tax=Thalassotalea fonticola TaxID=3065649 RepID=A0ABZ0GNH3_9GAMM|nr:hypothetical protein RI844_19140 [Colwelliaceae bacterium S1-1]